VFTKAQQILTRLPPWAIGWLANFVSVEWILRRVFDRYWGLTSDWDDVHSSPFSTTMGDPLQLESSEHEFADWVTAVELETPHGREI
jgi:hypothetical protein